jgi:hypothetical protein
VNIAIHSHRNEQQVHLPHQSLWFVVLLLALLLMLSKTVSSSIVDRPSSIVEGSSIVDVPAPS